MKKCLTGICLIVCINLCYSNSSDSIKRFSFKFYGMTITETSERLQRFPLFPNPNFDPYTQITEKSGWRIFHPTFAFLWKTKANNFQEIELTFFEVKNDDILVTRDYDDLYYDVVVIQSGNERTTTHISIRYEYIYHLTKSSDSRLGFSIGGGIQPYFLNISDIPALSNQFPSSERNLGAFFQIIPRINIELSESFFLDFNIPFCFYNLNHRVLTREDPALIEDLRRQTFTDSNFFPDMYSLRIGLGYSF